MVQVASPPLLRIPKEMIGSDVERVFWKNMQDFLFRLWKRTGGAEDFSENAENLLVDVDTKSSRNAALIDYIINREKIVITDASITAKPFDTVVCTNTASINVTLEPNPKTGDIINVKRTDAEVVVIGTIDGVVDKIINVQYWSMKLVYSGSEWSAV